MEDAKFCYFLLGYLRSKYPEIMEEVKRAFDKYVKEEEQGSNG